MFKNKSFLKILLIVTVGIALVPQLAFALPFGGKSTAAQLCTCVWDEPMKWLITLTPAAGGLPYQVIYQPLVSRIYPYGQVYRGGVYMLGTYSAYTTCLMQAGWYCTTRAVAPLIQMVGTSM